MGSLGIVMARGKRKKKGKEKQVEYVKTTKHAYSNQNVTIRKPVTRSLGAMVLIAVRRCTGFSGANIADIMVELTAMRVQITRALLESVLEYFYEKRVLRLISEQRYEISKSPRTTKFLKKMFPISIKDLF